jgi:hypothetical protein
MASDFTDGLRKLADLIDECELRDEIEHHNHLIYCADRDEMMSVVRKIGGKWSKGSTGSAYFEMTRELTDAVAVQVYVPRQQVCTANVVGTKTVKRADPNAPLVEVEEDVIEWECDPILLARV